jgi:hypothetical protein
MLEFLPALLIHSVFQISERERTNAELFYLSLVARTPYKSEMDRHADHPRWETLCKRKYFLIPTSHVHMSNVTNHSFGRCWYAMVLIAF